MGAWWLWLCTHGYLSCDGTVVRRQGTERGARRVAPVGPPVLEQPCGPVRQRWGCFVWAAFVPCLVRGWRRGSQVGAAKEQVCAAGLWHAAVTKEPTRPVCAGVGNLCGMATGSTKLRPARSQVNVG